MSSAWTSTGVRDLKHLAERIKMHRHSDARLRCAVKFKTFDSADITSQLSESYDLSVRRHNEAVDRNRHILCRIIDAIKI